MKLPTDGGAAFPRTLPDVEVTPDRAMEIIQEYSGMTLRDYFAGIALQGILTEPIYKYWVAGFVSMYDMNSKRTLASVCYAMADAMLVERSKEVDYKEEDDVHPH